MEKTRIKEIYENPANKSNKDLFEAKINLETEFEQTKNLIVELTRHLETIETFHRTIIEEIKQRSVKK
jgi:hypothetical protein